jgi:putative phosphoesterase
VRVAALYDIHGNLPALEAVLPELEELRPDLVLVGGDVVLGPFPRETLERLTALGDRVRFIRGNTDRLLLEEAPDMEDPPPWPDRHAWTRAQLTEDERRFLAERSDTAVVEVEGLGAVLFCHGSPRSDEEIITRATPPERLSDILAGVEQRVVVCGHTHVQFDRVIDGIRVVNAGSIGMPYEEELGAYWALLGEDVELRRTAYDAEQAASLIRATDYPAAAEFAEDFVLHPSGPDEATEEFERMAAESGR